MSKKNKAVFAIFDTEDELEFAVSQLKLNGFRSSDVSCLIGRGGNRDLVPEKHTKAPEGSATGATAGAALGGALGWLVGIGALTIPGLGPFIAAGPILAALAGASVGGAVGGVTGALVGAGIPEYEARKFESLLKEGKVLLAVHCDDSDWVEKAKDILSSCGGDDISSTTEASATLLRDTTLPPDMPTHTPMF